MKFSLQCLLVICLQLLGNPLWAASQDTNTILGIYGKNQIALVKLGDLCLIGMHGIESKDSMVFWGPAVPGLFIIIPETKDINTASNQISHFLDSNDNADLKPSDTVLNLANHTVKAAYDNKQVKKYDVMIAVSQANESITLSSNKNFSVDFYKLHEQSGITKIQFDLEGFNEAYTALNKLCENQ